MQIKNFLVRDSIFIILSVLVSAVVFYHRQPINPDGRLYVWSAQAFLSHGVFSHFLTGWREALTIYDWPFYASCMAAFSQVTGLSALQAGLTLTTIFMALIVCLLMRLVSLLKADQYIAILMGIVFLASHYFNHYRDNIMRGYGYLFFALLALMFFISFLRSRRFLDALMWMMSISLATAFRVEGIVLAYLVPWVVLALPGKRWLTRCIDFCKIYLIQIIVLMFIVFWFKDSNHLQMKHLGRFDYIIRHAREAGHALFSQGMLRYKQVLTVLLQDTGAHVFAILLVCLTFLGKIIQALLFVLSLPYVVLAYLGMRYGEYQWDRATQVGWCSFVAVIVLTLFIHLSAFWFTSTRFVLLLSVLIMLFVPFGLKVMWQASRQTKKPWYGRSLFIGLMALGLLYNVVAGLGHFGTSKSYLIDAGYWFDQHVPKPVTVVTNNTQFKFYANRQASISVMNDNTLFLAYLNGRILNFDVVAIKLKAKQQHSRLAWLEHKLSYRRCISFHNVRGDGLYIFSRLTLKGCQLSPLSEHEV